ncbi:MAG TPA: transketolase C-terminal domain-containing protein [Candidatus Sulfotelmatobacter sp.]|nr:transketolase C-terminal domain-containing protein [Candidatus Sulfotelmatobacter sp.]
MRTAFLNELFELAKQDPRIVFVTGDLGFSVVENFMQELPRQFLNAGVAEQNMTGMAAGMAMSGKIVFTYSIANFPTLRCLEHIRNDVCYHQANVKIVSVGGGFAYGSMGATHHATEDLGVMRMLPGITVIAPGDPKEARCATRAVVEYVGPCYLRLGKAGEPEVHKGNIDFEIGKAVLFRDGLDLTLISTGGLLQTAAKVADALARLGISARVLSMHTLKPLDTDAVLAAATETGALLTLEEHSITGGLGSAVAEVLAENDSSHVLFHRIGLPPNFSPYLGTQDYMQRLHGLDVDSIVESVLKLLSNKRVSQASLVGVQ